jgi:hypothetical protein
MTKTQNIATATTALLATIALLIGAAILAPQPAETHSAVSKCATPSWFYKTPPTGGVPCK